jgi:hypothetical protein
MRVSRFVATAALGLLAGCGGSSATVGDTALPTPTDDGSTAAANPAVAACFAKNRPDQPDILVREKDPRLTYTAQQLGGGYVYNYSSNECQDSVAFTLATVSDDPGYCVQIALASDNPGYDANAEPAPPLRKVIASKGTC